MQDLVLVEAQALQPSHGGLAFLAHVGNDSRGVQGGIAVDHAVEQEHLDAVLLSLFQDLVPASGLSGGNQNVGNAVGDEALGGLQLLVGGGSGDEGGVIAVLLGEGIGQVLDVRLTIAGLGGIQVDDANLDAFGHGGHGAQGHDQSESQHENLLHSDKPPFLICGKVCR